MRANGEVDIVLARCHAGDASCLLDQRQCLGFVEHACAAALSSAEQGFRRALAGAIDFQRRTARETDSPIGELELPLIERQEAQALLLQPEQCLAAVLDQHVGQVGMAAILGHSGKVVVILLARIGAELRALTLRRAQSADQRIDILDAMIDSADGAVGEPRIATAFGLRRLLQNDDRRAGFAGRDGGTQPRHAGADDEHISLFDVDLIRCGGCGTGRHVFSDVSDDRERLRT